MRLYRSEKQRSIMCTLVLSTLSTWLWLIYYYQLGPFRHRQHRAPSAAQTLVALSNNDNNHHHNNHNHNNNNDDNNNHNNNNNNNNNNITHSFSICNDEKRKWGLSPSRFHKVEADNHNTDALQHEAPAFWGTVHFPPVPSYHINTHDPVHEDIYISGSVHHNKEPWDPYIWDVFVRFLTDPPQPNAVVVDVGANIGYFTLMAAAMGHTVIAFEPMPHNVARLRSSIQRNGFEQRITLYQNAVSHTSNERVALRPTHVTNQGNGRIVFHATAASAMTTTVRLDDLPFDRNTQISLMKIDVEGFETSVLDGALQLICTHPVNAIVMELSDATKSNSECSARRMLAHLESIGYKITDVVAGAPLLSASLTPWEAFPPNILLTYAAAQKQQQAGARCGTTVTAQQE